MKKKPRDGDVTEKSRVTLWQPVTVEMEEKKSVFIGHAAPVRSEDEARAFLDEKRKTYHDATHNVYAYLLHQGALARYSDDGEPQGTAGIPVLNVLKMSGATDLVVVVTRYFGGILLGAGGLVRAYGKSAKMAVDAAGLAVYEPWVVLSAPLSYSDYQKAAAALPKLGAIEEGTGFAGDVTLRCAVSCGNEEAFRRAMAELTYGKAAFTVERTEERLRKLS